VGKKEKVAVALLLWLAGLFCGQALTSAWLAIRAVTDNPTLAF